MSDITKLRELLGRATPGEWRSDIDTYGDPGDITLWAEGENYVVNIGHAGDHVENGCVIAFDGSKANAALIAAAVNALPALLDEVERLRLDAERYRYLMERSDSPAICEYCEGEWLPIQSRRIEALLDAAMQEQPR